MDTTQYKNETKTDGNGNPYSVRVPVSSNVISSAALAPVTPVAIPTSPADTTNYKSITDGVIGNLGALTQQTNVAQGNVDNSQKGIIDTMGALLGKTADTQAANESSGLNDATKQLNLLNAQAQSLNREAQATPIQTQQRNANTGATDAGVAPQNTAALRENALKALSIAQQADIATANYTAAKDKAQQIIDLKYKPEEAKLELRKQQYEFAKDALAAYDKKRADALGVALKKEENELAAKKAAEKEVKDLAFTLQINGAPTDIITKALAAKTKQDIQAIAGVGDYLISKADKLDMQLKSLQIQKARQDLVPTKGLTDQEVAKITGTPEYKTINGVLPALLAIKKYRDAVEQYGSYEALDAKGKGERKAAYGNAISAWKTLAGLGALSGADFGLAENVIPEGSLFARNNKQLAQLDSAIESAQTQADMLSKRITQLYPKSSDLITQQLSDIKKITDVQETQTPEQKKELYWSSVDTLIPAVQSSAAYSSAGYNTN